MKRLLFIDTETTGIPVWGRPSESPEQPSIVQLAMLLVDSDTQEHLAGGCFLIQPGVTWPQKMPTEVFAVHGISREDCEHAGVGIPHAVELFRELLGQADILVGHNVSFDVRMIRIEYKRGTKSDDPWLDELKEFPKFDTANKSTKIVRLPPTAKMKAANQHRFKTPTLTEAHQFFFGEAPRRSHHAFGDLIACKRVYFAIKKHDEPAEEQKRHVEQNPAPTEADIPGL